MIRHKQPDADLARGYRRLLGAALAASVGLHAGLFLLNPSFELRPPALPVSPPPLRLEPIPATPQAPALPQPLRGAQSSPPAPAGLRPHARPALPEVVTQFPLEAEDEAVEYWMLEKQPHVLRRVLPEYPDSARMALVEGRVYVRMLLDRRGYVERIGEVSGPAMLHRAAVAAARQWQFTPAVQNEQTVKVWISLPFAFCLE
ncbi:MAG: energy transducer TonB [Candidatus Latescibacterota bacterium]